RYSCPYVSSVVQTYTECFPLSLHDALQILLAAEDGDIVLMKLMLQNGADPDLQDCRGMTALHSAIKSRVDSCVDALLDHPCALEDRKSTRLNSSHVKISYAVFCL